MTTLSKILVAMFTEPTTHFLTDSGSIYGRSYQMNAQKNLETEPSATLRLHENGYAEISISMFQMLNSTLDIDDLCREYNALPCLDWDAGMGISTDQMKWIRSHEAEPVTPWNSCNWENNFDQVIQGWEIEINHQEYILISVHGGCDVRSGYTDTKLFKIEDPDCFMFDDASFCLNDPTEPEYQQRYVDYRSPSELEIYHHDTGDTEVYTEEWGAKLYKFNQSPIAGDSSAVSH